ncbi:UpxY family transcription antiterminator [Polaribacter sp.]|nr:UpxY family transcription antiterminator [Polaribacter sp.]MDC0086583.1 UpxY family transcription antiterminator [Polaribacter sp.]
MKGKTENWYVLYTKPRNELKVMERFLSAGFEAYTPFKTEIRKWSDRNKKIRVPLLTSIVLVKVAKNATDSVFGIPGVVRFLFEGGKRAEIYDAEVLAMKAHLEENYISVEKKLLKGDTVVVPSINEEATVLSVKGKSIIAELNKLGAKVSFQLN